MCRWITLLSSEPVSLSDIVLAPSNSLVQLSKDASFHPEFSNINNHNMNGDGFGVGWYHSNVATGPHLGINVLLHEQPRAAVFKDTQPAWNNVNLKEICMATASNCIIAHVRAASEGSGVSQANCQPFKSGRLLFCHNGRIDSYAKIKRKFINQVSDEMYYTIKGTTDSEVIFALILTHLSKDGHAESPLHQTTPFGHKRLVAAIKKTLRQIDQTLIQAGVTEGFSTCNFSLTDGETVVVTRFCDKSPDVPPPSLYFAYGNTQHLYEELTSDDPVLYVQQLSDSDSEHSGSQGDGSDSENEFIEQTVDLNHHLSLPGTIYSDVDPSEASFIVASNPLTKTHTWHPMPKNSVMWCTRGSHPEMRLLKLKNTMSMQGLMMNGSM